MKKIYIAAAVLLLLGSCNSLEKNDLNKGIDGVEQKETTSNKESLAEAGNKSKGSEAMEMLKKKRIENLKSLPQQEVPLKLEKEQTQEIKQNVKAEPKVDNVPDFIVQRESDNIIVNKATEALDVGLCKGLSSDISTSNCKLAVTVLKSKKESNIDLCKTLGNEESVRNCNNSYYLEKAINKGDVGLCDNITNVANAVNESNNCKLSIAINKAIKEDRIDSCKELDIKELKNVCINNFYSKKAFENDDIKFCNDMVGEDEQSKVRKNSCVTQIIIGQVLKTQDIKLCDNMLTDIDKEMCKKSIKK